MVYIRKFATVGMEMVLLNTLQGSRGRRHVREVVGRQKEVGYGIRGWDSQNMGDLTLMSKFKTKR